MTDYKTIQVSAETHGRLCKMKIGIEKILRTSVSFEQLILILLSVKPLEEAISELILMVE